MQRFFLFLLLLLLVFACENRVDSQRRKVAARERELIHQHTEEIRKLEAENKRQYERERKLANEQQPAGFPQEPPPDQHPATASKERDQLYYFNGTKQVAVRVSAWKNGGRTVTCYNRQGEPTYTFKDISLGYAELTTLESFHPNGAANHIRHNSSYSGTSSYLHEINYWFDTDNYPLKKETKDITGYAESVQEDPGPAAQTWDRSTKTWK